MGNSSKPRKAYRPRHTADPIIVAMQRIKVLTAEQQAGFYTPAADALDLLRTGEFDALHFQELCNMSNLGYALMLPGIGIAPDHEAKFDALRESLGAIVARRNAKGKWIASGDELRAIDEALEIYAIQLQFASQGDVNKAVAEVNNKITGGRSARGSAGERYERFDIVDRVAA